MNINERISRIKRMEDIFNRSKRATAELDKLLPELEELIEYYGSKEWFEDLSADENGELPQELSRGVLSEDGIYNFLSELQDLKKKLESIK